MSCLQQAKKATQINQQVGNTPPLTNNIPLQQGQPVLTALEKQNLLATELDLIQDPALKKFATVGVTLLPNYFFKVPASSSGKYHHPLQNVEGGLLLHTKSAVRIAQELFRMAAPHTTFSAQEQDLIICALIFHDGWKDGLEANQQPYTQSNHAVLANQSLIPLKNLVSDAQFQQIQALVASHEGRWNRDYRTGTEITPLPKTKMEWFVHEADYLASRRSILIDFAYPASTPD